MPTGSLPRDALQRLLDGLQALIREHLALARVEAKEDLRGMGRDLAVSAAGLPALLVGYVFLMLAAALGLSSVLPAWAAFGIVAVVNLSAGAALTRIGTRRVARAKPALQHTGEELQKDRAWLSTLKDGTAPSRLARLEPAQNP